jgi:hypothetical protein
MMMKMQSSPVKEIISKQTIKFAKHIEYEKFINKVSSSFFHFNFLFITMQDSSIHYISCMFQFTHLVVVLGYGGFCFLLGASVTVYD